MILFVILLIGFSFLGLVIKIAEGMLRIFLILIVLLLIILGSIFGSHGQGQSTQFEHPSIHNNV